LLTIAFIILFFMSNSVNAILMVLSAPFILHLNRNICVNTLYLANCILMLSIYLLISIAL
jgi:hypothetical protein